MREGESGEGERGSRQCTHQLAKEHAEDAAGYLPPAIRTARFAPRATITLSG